MNRCRNAFRRGFSLVELMIALTITATLLTATLAAFNTSFQSYKLTSESAGTHVVARIIMQRVTAMIRTGDRFGPYPANPVRTPIITSNRLEFVSFQDPANNTEHISTLERRAGDEDTGPYELWYTVTVYQDGSFSDFREERLLENLVELEFTLEYEVGPRLKRATIDMLIRPDDLDDAAIAADLDAPTIRLVASAAPRGED